MTRILRTWKERGRKGIFNNNMIEHWYITKLIQKKTIYDDDKKDNE